MREHPQLQRNRWPFKVASRDAGGGQRGDVAAFGAEGSQVSVPSNR